MFLKDQHLWQEVEKSKIRQRRKSEFHVDPPRPQLTWLGALQQMVSIGVSCNRLQQQGLCTLISLSHQVWVLETGWPWVKCLIVAEVDLGGTDNCKLSVHSTVGWQVFFWGGSISISASLTLRHNDMSLTVSSAVTTACPKIRYSNSTWAQEHVRNCF